VDGENQISLRDGGAYPTSERAIVILVTSERMLEPRSEHPNVPTDRLSFDLQ